MRGSNTRHVVMIADDDLFIRKVLKAALGHLSQIVEVTDGADVINTYKTCQPDMLFLDIHLPNASGLDLIPALLSADKSAFIVMLSADSSADNVTAASKHGAAAFLTKPFEKARVLELFKKATLWVR